QSVDLAFLCGSRESLDSALELLPESATSILLAPDPREDDGPRVVAGINVPQAFGGVVVSPHPAVVGACHLLHPLSGFGPTTAVATVLQPASMYGEEGLDELFEQTRRVLAFSSDRPEEIFQRQLAFNLLPLAKPLPGLGAEAREILGGKTEVALHVLQGGVFHGTSVSLFVRLAEDPGEAAVREALEASPFLRLEEETPLLSPIDVAAQDEMLVGEISREPGAAGIYRLWAVLDNLTLGSAVNALHIAEGLLQPGLVS
ncbi:MAG: hypothetical protein KDD47_21190, partial [Acidobacteria bacterium]|nr:hypothetical protein [Acidobacteriota bacterium]